MSDARMYPGTSPEERTTFAPYSAFDIPADLRQLHGRYDVEATGRNSRDGETTSRHGPFAMDARGCRSVLGQRCLAFGDLRDRGLGRR